MNHRQALHLVNHKVKRHFDSKKEAAYELGIDQSHFYAMLKGTRPLTGFVAKWAGLKPIKKITYTYEEVEL
jgi:hypothetical protein